MNEGIIQNRVAESELITLDLKTFLPQEKPIQFDLSNYLFKGLILKEKDYRATLAQTDWTFFADKIVLVQCSADAIIPVWAYMLAVIYLKPVAREIYFDDTEGWKKKLLLKNINEIEVDLYKDKRVVIKGCGEEKIPGAAYFEITKKLLPVVKSLLYGEPCSTVPVYKKK
jgi:hypothetical protein